MAASFAQDSSGFFGSTAGSVGVGLGHTSGHGTLKYHEGSYSFKLSGVSLIDVGAAKISTAGEVYDLRKLEDFSGNYSAVTAGATVAAGGSVAYLRKCARCGHQTSFLHDRYAIQPVRRGYQHQA